MSWSTDGAPDPTSVVPPGTPVPVTVVVSPVRPGQVVTVDYRVNGGPVRQMPAVPAPPAPGIGARQFHAVLPGQVGALVEFLPVLRFAGQPISPRLGESAECGRYEAARAPGPVEVDGPHPPLAAPGAGPRWAWNTTFLGSLTAVFGEETIGATADGLRIRWFVEEASFVGPELDGVLRPGMTDWMRIRTDGVGVVDVQACLETRTGARLYLAYGGIVDLGVGGYSRWLRGEFDPLPPIVVTPTFTTADPQLEWLNRAQCIGVGRVVMSARRLEFDTYVVRAGGRADEA